MGASVFWTDVVPDYKILTLVNSDTLIVQFLSTEQKEEMSWDAATRHAWNHLFSKASPFGRSAAYHEACRFCLSTGFSRSHMTLSSPMHQAIQRGIDSELASFRGGHLADIVDKIVSRTLLTIFLGPEASSLNSTFDDLCNRLMSGKHDTKLEARLAHRLLCEIDGLVQARLADPEHSANDDYLNFILSDQSRAMLTSSSATAPVSEGRNSAESASDATTRPDPASKADAVKNLPDHFLTALLQTRMLVATCVFWKIYSATTSHSTVGPDPLLLVRQASEETLLGSIVIPKNAFVAICPLGELNEHERGMSSRGYFSRNQSSTELTELSTAYSAANLSDLGSHDGSTLPHSISFGSFSPLLHGARRPSQSSAYTPKPEQERQTLLGSYRSKQGTWQRHYPQGHLISLMVGSISNALSQQLIITGSSEAKAVYGDASSLYLPQAAEPISVIKGSPQVLQAPVSFYSASRSNSTFLHPSSKTTAAITEALEEVHA